VASALMSAGRLTELDDFVSALVARFRTEGPPTLLYVTLAMLGYSAWFQGRADEAERLFDESASIEVPARTSSVNEPAQARKAFKSGHQSQAFRILHAHVHDLLASDYTDLARLAAVEFINMLTATGHLPEAGRILGYLAGSGDFGALAVHALVADAAARIEADASPPDGSTRPDLDGRQALEYMRDVLNGLLNSQPDDLPVCRVEAPPLVNQVSGAGRRGGAGGRRRRLAPGHEQPAW